MSQSLTKLNGKNPLWVVQAYCRRTPGEFFIYVDDFGNAKISLFLRRIEDANDPKEYHVEKWKDGVCVWKDNRNVTHE